MRAYGEREGDESAVRCEPFGRRPGDPLADQALLVGLGVRLPAQGLADRFRVRCLSCLDGSSADGLRALPHAELIVVSDALSAPATRAAAVRDRRVDTFRIYYESGERP